MKPQVSFGQAVFMFLLALSTQESPRATEEEEEDEEKNTASNEIAQQCRMKQKKSEE